MLFSEPLKSAVYIQKREREKSAPTYDFALPQAPIGRRADCEGIKFVIGELRREWRTEERDLCAGKRTITE